MKVIWRDAAIADLDAIYDYLSLHSAVMARGTVNRLVARADDLGDFPLMGRIVPELQDDALREPIERPYRIIYRPLEHVVEVLTVVHVARGSLPMGSLS
jgi:toxin ParE1/3/4